MNFKLSFYLNPPCREEKNYFKNIQSFPPVPSCFQFELQYLEFIAISYSNGFLNFFWLLVKWFWVN